MAIDKMDLDLILKCRICEKILQPPIRRCGVHSMHLFCQKCIASKNNKCTECQNPVLTSNNVAMEALLKVHKFKCKNGTSKVQLISAPEKLDHGRYQCEVNKYCELRNPCTWIGGYNQIAQHFYSHTHLMTLMNSTRMTIQINTPNRYVRLLKAHDQLFWYKHVVCTQKQKVYFTIQTINHNESKKFEFKIIFSDASEIWTLYGDCSDDLVDQNVRFLVSKGKDVRFQDLLPFIRGESVSMVLEVNEKQNFKLPNSNHNQDGNSQTTKQSIGVELKQNERVNCQTAKNVVRIERKSRNINQDGNYQTTKQSIGVELKQNERVNCQTAKNVVSIERILNVIVPIDNNQAIGANHREQRERDRSRNITDSKNNFGIHKTLNPVKTEQNDKKHRISIKKLEVTPRKDESSFRASCLASLVEPKPNRTDPNPSQLRPPGRSKKTTQNQNDNGIDKSHTQGQNEQTNRKDKIPNLAEERDSNIKSNKLEITRPKNRYDTSLCLPHLVESIVNRNEIRPIQSTQGGVANHSQLREQYQSRNITANQNDNGKFKNCCDIL